MTQHPLLVGAEQAIKDVRPAGHYRCFEYAGTSVGYCSDEGESARWMERFFDGYFVASDRTAAAATIYSTADAVLFAALQRSSSGGLELGKNEYADVPVTENVTLIHTKATKVTPEEDVYCLLFHAERQVVLVTSGHLEVRREESMQTLRALMKWLLLEKGWIPMHAACAAKGGRVICVAGGKASGKTSTLLNLLARNGCDLVAIDKFLMQDTGAHLEICGLPGKSGVRVGSAVGHPRLLDWLSRQEAPFFPQMDAAEVRRIAETNTAEQLRKRKEKMQLLPVELTALFGASITPSAPLALVLVPVYDPTAEQSRLVRVDREQAVAVLTECYAGLFRKGEDFLLRLFDVSDAELKGRLATMLNAHASEVPTYELHQSHRTNEQSAELVAGLLG